MMRISVWHGNLSDAYLRQVTQLGADYLDFGQGDFFPGVKDQGYPDLDELLEIKKRIRSWGLDINRVTLPHLTDRFMRKRAGGEEEIENACRALRVFGEARVPIARARFAGDTFDGLTTAYPAAHRGGYVSRGESLESTRNPPEPPSMEDLQQWWDRFCDAYSLLVPIAEEYGVMLGIHPSDTPNADTPLGSLGFHRVIDAFPSRNVGYVYCVGTRSESGGTPLVLDEINNYGRKGRILTVHFRNVRGSLATARGFEEGLLDDGDMNMYQILLELHKVGFSGCLNPDHIPGIEGDAGNVSLGLAYSIGYIKALLGALSV